MSAMLACQAATSSGLQLGQSAAALLPVAVSLHSQHQPCPSLCFAANIDSAEKGSLDFAIPLTGMKRSSTSEKTQPAELQSSDATGNAGQEQGASTGVDVHITPDIRIKDLALVSIGPEKGEINPTISATPSSQSTGDFPNTADSNAQKEDTSKGKKSITKNTGYENIIERNYFVFTQNTSAQVKTDETYPQGWPQLAAFLNSSDNFAIFRRFGTAHCRILLHLQAEITKIEKQLDQLDKTDSETDLRYRLKRNEWYEGWDTAQKELLERLIIKLAEYDDILLKDSNLRSLARTSTTDHLSVFHWIWGRKPLDKGEYDFIFHRDDFVSLAKKPRDAFDRFIVESCLSRWPKALQKVMHGKKQVHGTNDHEVFFFSNARITLVAKLMAVCVAVTLLMTPVFLLYLTDISRKTTSIVVLFFVLAFAILISLFTGAKVETVFVGTCTYCAVLVTFMGNIQGRVAVAGTS